MHRRRRASVDGRWAHRIRTEGDRAGASSGFYVAYMDGWPAGYVKNNRTGEEVRWKTQGAFISQQDKAPSKPNAPENNRSGPKSGFSNMKKRQNVWPGSSPG